jgi:hypothetical protein
VVGARVVVVVVVVVVATEVEVAAVSGGSVAGGFVAGGSVAGGWVVDVTGSVDDVVVSPEVSPHAATVRERPRTATSTTRARPDINDTSMASAFLRLSEWTSLAGHTVPGRRPIAIAEGPN